MWKFFEQSKVHLERTNGQLETSGAPPDLWLRALTDLLFPVFSLVSSSHPPPWVGCWLITICTVTCQCLGRVTYAFWWLKLHTCSLRTIVPYQPSASRGGSYTSQNPPFFSLTAHSRTCPLNLKILIGNLLPTSSKHFSLLSATTTYHSWGDHWTTAWQLPDGCLTFFGALSCPAHICLSKYSNSPS